MAAHTGVVSGLYYARSLRGLGSTGDIRKTATRSSPHILTASYSSTSATGKRQILWDNCAVYYDITG